MISKTSTADFEGETYRKVVSRLVPLLFVCYVIAILDRVNVGFAKLQMAGDLKFSDTVYGFGAGIFFIGYFIFEVPSNIMLARVGASVWIACMMITWGVIASAFSITPYLHFGAIATMLHSTDAELAFYVLRFLLGVAEAGFFPGVILYLTYWFPGSRRAKVVALFMAAIPVSNALGSPISGAIMQGMDGVYDWRGWQWLFLVESLPSIVIGAAMVRLLPDGPKDARWLSDREKELVLKRVRESEETKRELGRHDSFVGAFRDWRVWALALVYFCGALCFHAVNLWMPTIIQELGIDKGDFLRVGLLSSIPWGTAAVAMVLWASHSDRSRERRWHAAGGLMLAMAGLVLLASIGKAAIPSLIALTMVTCGICCLNVTFWSLPTAFLSGTAAAAGIAWINAVGNLGGYFGPDMIGRIRTASGGRSEAAFFALAAAAFVGVVVLLRLTGTQPRRASV